VSRRRLVEFLLERLRLFCAGFVDTGLVQVCGNTARPFEGGAGPAAGHPERLQPGVPLSDLERGLNREMTRFSWTWQSED
jgi:Family of unknown function (DUF6059)